MSMILDALTRAEHERQLEKQPDLKFVNPVKPQKKNPKKIWLWVALGILVNALILFIAIRAITDNKDTSNQMVAAQNQTTQKSVTPPSVTTSQQSLQQDDSFFENENSNQQRVHSDLVDPTRPNELEESRPLAMELETAQSPSLDRPLIYESKQTSPSNTDRNSQKPANAPSTNTQKGSVSFSATELSVGDSAPIIEKPKLLIDQGESVASNMQPSSSSSVPKLRDLPESSRNDLNRYEVNVHVFDTDPIRRFVLINMDKYKEGDRIANNGPLVEEITPQGVVVDYGSGRALLPPK